MYHNLSEGLCAPSAFKTEDALADGCANADYLFKGLWDQFTGASGNSYNQAITLVGERCNWNSGWGCRLMGNTCYRPGLIECVLSTYTNLVKKHQVPEYDRTRPAEAQTTEALIATNSMQPLGQVQRIMLELYNAVHDGSLPAFALKPLTAETTANWGKRPDGTEPDIPNPFKIGQALIKYAPAIAIGGGLCVAAFYGTKLFRAANTVRKVIT